MILVLSKIEESFSFRSDDLKDSSSWDLHVDIPVQNLLDCDSNKTEEIRYIIKILSMYDYITFNAEDHFKIIGVTGKGFKFMRSELHDINII